MTPRQLRTHLVMNHRRADIQIRWAQPKAMSMNEKDLLQAARRMQYATEKIETLARAKGVYEDACAVSCAGCCRTLRSVVCPIVSI